jgi:hypothetical protein
MRCTAMAKVIREGKERDRSYVICWTKGLVCVYWEWEWEWWERVGTACLVLRLKTCLLLPLPAKLNGTNGKEAEQNYSKTVNPLRTAKASHWKKLATELRPDPKRACGQGLGPFPFLSSRRTAGLGLYEAGVLTVLLCVSFGSRTTADYVAR